MKRFNKVVFPLPASPKITILKRASYILVVLTRIFDSN
jgi:hypothetical protein